MNSNPISYIVIKDWMIRQLNLSGNPLIVFACIYGLTQTNYGGFVGSLQCLADGTGVSKRQLQEIIKNLKSKGLVKQEQIMQGGVMLNRFFAVDNSLVDNLDNSMNNVDNFSVAPNYTMAETATPMAETATPIAETATPMVETAIPIAETATNNNIINIIKIKKECDARAKCAFDKFFKTYPRQHAKERAWASWVQAIKKATPDQIIAGLARAKASDPRFLNGVERYIPLASNWLDGLEWANTYAANNSKGDRIHHAATNRALNYKQKVYTAEELQDFGVSFGDEVYA